MMLSRYRPLPVMLASSTLFLAACGGSDEEASVGGVLTGLVPGSSITLKNGGADTVTLTANGTFTFATRLAGGVPYSVTVSSLPLGEDCSVGDGNGQIVGNDDVTNVSVDCVVSESLTGTVSGLVGGTSLVLSNGRDFLPISANGTFAFPGVLAAGAPYVVTISTLPIGESCTLTHGSGTVPAVGIVAVSVACS